MVDVTYPRIPEADYKKAIFHLRGELLDALEPLRRYGQSEFVDGAIQEIIELAEQFSMVTRGKNTQIKLKRKYTRKAEIVHSEES
jgi:hypothetical protein